MGKLGGVIGYAMLFIRFIFLLFKLLIMSTFYLTSSFILKIKYFFIRRRVGNNLLSEGLGEENIKKVIDAIVPKPPSLFKVIKDISKVKKDGGHLRN